MRNRWSHSLAIGALLCTALSSSACLLPQQFADERVVDPAPSRQRKEDLQATQEAFLSRFAAHEPIYFSVGFNEVTNAKFQFSFKYRIADPEGLLIDAAPSFWSGIHFGYTQTSFWDLESASAPFFDTNFRPSLFWFRDRIAKYSSESLKFGFEAGVEHESNGQGGATSRSLNIIYIRPKWNWSLGNDDHFEIAPKVWTYVGDLDDNTGIEDFRGYFQLRTRAYDEDGLQLSSELRIGADTDHGYHQLDLSYPLNKIFYGELGAYLHLQYFNGWGESLRTFNLKTPSQFRIGVMLVR